MENRLPDSVLDEVAGIMSTQEAETPEAKKKRVRAEMDARAVADAINKGKAVKDQVEYWLADAAEMKAENAVVLPPVEKLSQLTDADLRPDPFKMPAEDVVANTPDPLSNLASRKRAFEKRKLEMGR